MFKVNILLKNGKIHSASINKMEELDSVLSALGYAISMVRSVQFLGV